MYEQLKESVTIRDLGDGLILRRSTPQDALALAEFNARLHSDNSPENPDQGVAAWTRDLLERPHPTFRAGDFTIVEDIASAKIVSSLNLISQTWSYAGIPFGVGRPELVGTLLEYRNRGLVRLQFEVVHTWSAQRGEQVQAITGIPYYYRQFGYEMALDLDIGRFGYKPHVPRLKEGENEPFRIRPAVEADLGFISSLYESSRRRYLVSCVWDETLWRYELNGKSPDNVERQELRVIETLDGSPVGYLAHPPFNWAKGILVAFAFEIAPGHSWAAVTPVVIRYLEATGEAYAAQKGGIEFNSFGFWLGSEHPVYEVVASRVPRGRKPYAWYLRLADIPAFIRRIAPALEEALGNSPFAGHTGELKLTFKKGRLAAAEGWKPQPNAYSGDAAFPDLTFLQLLFGYRSLDELGYSFADCWWEDDNAYGLLKALFPKRVSHIWAVT
jgi:hypothetical protein